MKLPVLLNDNKGINKIKNPLMLFILIAMPLFHMWTASFGVYPSYVLSAVHWAFVGSAILLIKPLKFKGGWIIDFILFVLNLFVCYYQIRLQNASLRNAGIYSKMDIYVSVLAIVLAIIIAARVVGKILPIISVLFLLYAYYGRYLSGMWKTTRFSISRMAPYLFTAYDGIFGQTLTVSAQYIYLFVLFGAILEMTGAGKFFVDLSYALTHRISGGPAQAAVFSSMLMGTINGSGAANVVTTGTFTIPLMKKSGFKGSFSGAVEAVASSGGQIMPPVMGAVAFLMSEMTGIAYGKIAIAAVIPAVLYYGTLSVSVYFISKKTHVEREDGEQIERAGTILKKGWPFFMPLVILIIMLVVGYSAQRAAFFAIVASLVIGFVMNRKEMTASNFIKALNSSVKGIVPIAGACILAGIIMGVINLTGLGLKISGIIVQMANGRLMVALLLAMLASLILGMGLPTSAAYMILAVLVAPALIKMGSSVMAAHLFILYFGALSTITPPVALSTFAAAGIAEASVWETGKDALKLASTGFVIPFVFIYSNELLMSGSAFGIIFAFVTAFLGCIVISASLMGWFRIQISIGGRIVLFVAAIMLFVAHPMYWNLVGLGLSAVVMLFESINNKRKQGVTNV